jgi:alginate O-acetyltransferase complex protein AlgJ
MSTFDATAHNFPRVLIGNEGWRFLGDGNNFSMSQMVGLIRAPSSVAHQWSIVLRSRTCRYGSRTKTFIMPEKACLYQRYLPEKIHVVPERFATFLSSVGWAHYIFYDHIKQQSAGDLYHLGDSHTTAYGGYEASAEIVRAIGLDVTDFQPTWSTRPVTSFDLFDSDEVRPALSERVISNSPSLEVVSNGLNNRGCVTRLVNPNGARHRLLIVGDSFANLYLCYGIALHVREVMFVHSVSFDYELIERYQPDYIVGEIAERFLIEPPAEGASLAWIVQSKLVDDMLSPAEAAQFMASYERFKNLYGPAMVPVLSEVQRRFGSTVGGS